MGKTSRFGKGFLVLTVPLLLFVLVVLAPAQAHAATYYVNQDGTEDFTDIQTALSMVAGGSLHTIIVRDDTYTGVKNRNLDFGGKAITLRSQNGPEACIINCENSGRGFQFVSGETAASVVDGFTITNANAAYGGAIGCISSPTITNCIITGNVSSNYGGAICIQEGSPTITNCAISDNTANWGGAIFLRFQPASPTITDCTFSGNSAISGSGGAIISDVFAEMTVTNCSFSSNWAANWGGAIACYPSSVTITNCIFGGNSAGAGGGGVNCYDTSPTITNCTFSGNSASVGGGIRGDKSSPTITNCILWNDLPDEILVFNGSPLVTYCDIEGGYTGAGNINADPQFIGGGDYHLTAGSPCIDAADDSVAPSNDIDGDARPQGAACDMGADEFVSPCYEFYGFIEPLPFEDNGELRTYKSNRVIPVKFRLYNSLGYEITSFVEPPVISVLYAGSSDTAGEPQEYDVTGQSDEGNTFRYSDDCWIFNLSMRSFAIGSSYDIVVTIPETGCTHQVRINLVK